MGYLWWMRVPVVEVDEGTCDEWGVGSLWWMRASVVDEGKVG